MPRAATRPRTSALATLVVVIAVLYLARDVLIPLALALLFSFLLVPLVRRLERWLGRALATIVVVLSGVALLAAIGWFAGNQAVTLAAKLPEYRQNIAKKIQSLRAPGDGDFAKAARALKDIEHQAAPDKAPLAVAETPASPHAALADFLSPFAKPLAMALAAIVFTTLVLINRDGLRERLMGLVGAGRINVTTQALGDVGQRVNRYLLMQLVVNALFGIPFGIALYLIGIPNAMLWGLLATLLRFIPYGGIWIAVALPTVLAFAISDGWHLVAWTLGTFVALELILVYLVEPWLYGKSAGLSPMAVIVGVLFWTWLWGPVGLLLATPMTVCVAVMGRYLPQLGFLNALLGVEPVLTPAARFYQRLVALEQEEAVELAEGFVKEHGAARFNDELLLPALRLAERDRHAGALDPACERSVFDNMREILQEMPGEAPQPPAAACIVAAHDEADHIAAQALAAASGARLMPFPLLANEVMQEIEKSGCGAICISAVPPHAATQAGYLAKRLRRRFPKARITVALWTDLENIDSNRSRLSEAGVDEVVTAFPEAVQLLRT